MTDWITCSRFASRGVTRSPPTPRRVDEAGPVLARTTRPGCAGPVKERPDGGPERLGQPAQGGDRRVGHSALDLRDEADRDPRPVARAFERQAPALAQRADLLPQSFLGHCAT